MMSRRSRGDEDLAYKTRKHFDCGAGRKSRQQFLELLRSAGYDASPAPTQDEGFTIVQNSSVDLLVLSADLSDLRCCNALAEIKGMAATASTRVILMTRGGGVERARGLDLGADDVLSPQWEPAELLARVRVQLRDKHVYEKLLIRHASRLKVRRSQTRHFKRWP